MTTPPVVTESAQAPRRLALRVVTMPRDTNHYGTIFGGVILSYIDQAGYVEARHHSKSTNQKWVTVALDRVEFKQPVHLGDVVSLYTQTTRAGTTSVTVRVEVEAERFEDGQIVPVTEASITLVCVDAAGRPTPFRQAAR
ncbi:MAG TPA: hotdog domain-containing protein [Phycisphaerales bacterium]|jgi:acyl-CoA thioesterase YciA|nr:hotdog domain-containing protein [Phycisphaerales bacterium]